MRAVLQDCTFASPSGWPFGVKSACGDGGLASVASIARAFVCRAPTPWGARPTGAGTVRVLRCPSPAYTYSPRRAGGALHPQPTVALRPMERGIGYHGDQVKPASRREVPLGLVPLPKGCTSPSHVSSEVQTTSIRCF